MELAIIIAVVGIGFYVYGSMKNLQAVSEQLEKSIADFERRLAEVEKGAKEEANKIYQIVFPKKKTIKEKVKSFFTKKGDK